MDMIKSRNLSSHTYNRNIAKTIVQAIRENYCAEFKQLLERLNPFTEEQQA